MWSVVILPPSLPPPPEGAVATDEEDGNGTALFIKMINFTKQLTNFNQSNRVQKTNVYTGTCGGSETSLNTVVHENVKVHILTTM